MSVKRDKITIIVDNIITPYGVSRYNEINKFLDGRFEVWFQAKTERDRNWKEFPQIYFKYRFLSNFLSIPINFEIFKLMGDYKYKIKRVVCCGWDSLTYLYIFWFCKRNKVRCTLWSGSTAFEKTWRRSLFLPITKLIISWADDYIAYGRRAKEYLISLGAKHNKIKIFLNSIDVDYYQKESSRLKYTRTELRKKYNIQYKDKVIIYIGQLIERKGIKELVAAFANIARKRSDLTLILVGDGRLREDIAQIISGISWAKIQLVDFIQYSQLPELYAVSDVLILPSKQEVWGLVVNEALASNLPVIVSQFAGCSRDLVTEDNGVLIKDISSGGIGKAIEKFLGSDKYFVSSSILERMRNKNYISLNFL